MKPHSLRRVLWLVNVGLGVAAVGLLAWFVLKVRPAVAKVTDRAANFQPEDMKQVRKEYENRRVTGLKWTPAAPVSLEDITSVVLHPEFKKLDPPHWIFSGPPPPTKVQGPAPAPDVRPKAEGLDALGQVRSLLYVPPDRSSVLFDFKDGKRLYEFGIGDFVVKGEGDARRFRLKEIVRLRNAVFEVRYDVFGDDPDTPEGEGAVVYDRSRSDEDFPPWFRPVGLEPKGGAEGAGGVTADGAATPAEDGDAAPGTDGEEGDEPTAQGPGARSPFQPGVVTVDSTSSSGEITLRDLKPILHVDEQNANRRAVEFDDNTYRYFRSRNAKNIAETVKTAVARDPATNRVIGLRLTGFQEDAPADVFDVRRGDILVSINGQRVESRSDAINIVQRLDPENLVTVVIDRNGRQITYKVDPRDPRNKRKVRYFENLR